MTKIIVRMNHWGLHDPTWSQMTAVLSDFQQADETELEMNLFDDDGAYHVLSIMTANSFYMPYLTKPDGKVKRYAAPPSVREKIGDEDIEMMGGFQHWEWVTDDFDLITEMVKEFYLTHDVKALT